MLNVQQQSLRISLLNWIKQILTYVSYYTFRETRKSIPLAMSNAIFRRSRFVNSLVISGSFFSQTSVYMSRLERKNVNKFPLEQYSRITQSLLPLMVHAPRRLTMLVCSPTWIRIFNSDARSLYWLTSCWSKINIVKRNYFYICLYLKIQKTNLEWVYLVSCILRSFAANIPDVQLMRTIDI